MQKNLANDSYMWNVEDVAANPAPAPKSPAYSLNSVRNALRIIRLLQETEDVSVSEAAATLGLGMSTAHRLLSTLTQESFVIQSATTKRYMLGTVLTQTMSAQFVHDLVSLARTPLRRLVDTVGETGHLVIRAGRNVDFIHVEETSRIVRLTSRVGKSLPAHATSSGKAMLAHLSAMELRRLYPEEALPSLTPNTRTRLDELERELEMVRSRGYAVNVAESEDDVDGISAPILDPNGIALAAISLAGPSQRFSAAAMTRRPPGGGPAPVELVLETARELSTLLARA
jgi:DNA-binding IclR family transcriptional regulator